MRIESSVTSVSWIPSEAIEGMTKLPFEMGVARYDEPPPDVLTNLSELGQNDRFRFANELRAWIEVEDGKITGAGYAGKGHISVSKLRVGSAEAVFQPIPLPDIRRDPEVTGSTVRFLQTCGGRTGLPAPRRVRRKPFVQVAAPLAWTTLALTIRADGTSDSEVVGASPFPRHWIYDDRAELIGKSGLIDFHTWYREAFGKHTPWGDQDSPALVTEIETALERELSRTIMAGRAAPVIRRLAENEALVEQGEIGTDVFLLLDGIVVVEVNGESLTEIGPGAILGERALLEGGRRTSTVRAVTPCKVAAVPGDVLDKGSLEDLARRHKRENDR